ncbi:5'-adenylylsulfate reductase-like 5 [Humulus lupulus]|uniref:5'-adenylylsulfate reductase-like 5 n=1 Tax=Humulus lupulus TaxID=3486 RepID=UPI002B418263|nr:5'-adenylylsulfate reductase-like 5 [Humulus lupulus]
MAVSLLLLCVTVFSALQLVSSLPLCDLQQFNSFVHALQSQSQCPPSISANLPLQVTGSFLDRTLTSKQKIGYTSVLFYGSWCPFSRGLYPKFEALSSMFPEIEHLAIEQSSAAPSVFSRYGIHSLPSILLVNQKSRVRYHGPKDLSSLVQFYEKTTGLEPAFYFDEEQPISLESGESSIVLSMNGSALKAVSKREPYLVFSILFLCFRVLVSIFPRMLSRVKVFWVSCVPHLNLGIIRETSQIMERVSHMIDVSGFWTKLRQCKTRNWREGARNARVWASSLASVSLGESSSART